MGNPHVYMFTQVKRNTHLINIERNQILALCRRNVLREDIDRIEKYMQICIIKEHIYVKTTLVKKKFLGSHYIPVIINAIKLECNT